MADDVWDVVIYETPGRYAPSSGEWFWRFVNEEPAGPPFYGPFKGPDQAELDVRREHQDYYRRSSDQPDLRIDVASEPRDHE